MYSTLKMYRLIFVKNVFLHGQNGKKSKKVRVLGILKRDPGNCFLDPINNRTTGPIFYFFFNRREILSFLIYYRTVIYIQNMDRFRVISKKTGKSPKISRFFGHQKLFSNQDHNFLIGRLFYVYY